MNQHFYFRWVLANAIGEGLGLGATMILAFGVDTTTSPASVSTVVFGAALAVLWGIAIEGVFLGLLQGWAIRSKVPGFPVAKWTIATAIGAGIAWLLGIIPSTVIGILTLNSQAVFVPDQSANEPSTWLQLLLAAVMGMILGPILGYAQIRVLTSLQIRCRWLLANSMAWGVGMPLIFLGMNFVPWDANFTTISVAVAAVCFIAGAVVGAVHGKVLLHALNLNQSQTLR